VSQHPVLVQSSFFVHGLRHTVPETVPTAMAMAMAMAS
jgi:hypothetical protein